MSINAETINTATINTTGGGGPQPLDKFCASFDQSWNVAALPLEQASFDQNWDLEELPLEQAPFDQSWNITIKVRQFFTYGLRLIVDAFWEYTLRLAASQSWTYLLKWGVRRAYEYPYPLVGFIGGKAFEYPWKLRGEFVNAPFEYPYALRVQQAWEYDLVLLSRVNNPFEYIYGLNERVNKPFEYRYDLKLLNRVNLPAKYIWSLLDEAALNVTGALELILDKTGEVIAIEEGAVQISEDNFTWTGSFTLADIGDIGKFQRNDGVTVNIYGETWAMIVESKDRGRDEPTEGSAAVRATLRTVSTSAQFQLPRAAPVTLTFATPITAQAAAETILGTTIDWQILDWTIPANRLAAEDADPAQFAASIVEAVGGVLETKPDGTLLARNRWPDPVLTWDDATTIPDQVYLESDAILNFNESFVPIELFNKFRIRDSDESLFSDRVEFEADEQDSLKGRLLVFPSPFRPVTVRTTGSQAISIVPVGEVILDKEECVEFEAGESSLGFPINTIVSVEYIEDDLGGISFEPGSQTITSAVNGYSLANIKYTTKALQFDVAAPEPLKAQFLVEDC
jgi:hypothetical protein